MERKDQYPHMRGIIQSQEDKEILFSYARNPKGFLLLAGSNGSGKTYAAEAIYSANTRYLLPNYDHDLAYFIDASMLYQSIVTSNFNYAQTLEKCLKTKLFVLDDLGANKKETTGLFKDFIYAVINHRWKNNLATIITTNLTGEDVRKDLGDAFYSRMASGIIFRWDHPDRRLNHE